MIDCKDLILDVEQAFESKRSHKEYLYSVKKDQLLTNADYKKVCEDLSQTIFDWNKAEFLEDTELANRLSLQVENLKQKKAQLEIKYGLKEFKPDCPICKDFGVTDNGRCQCFYTHLNNLCYEELGLKTPLLNDFSDDTLSNVNHTEKYFEKLQLYAKSFKNTSKNLIFTGKTGTGKTFLSKCVANEIAKNKNIVLFLSSRSLNNIAIENFKNPPAVQKNINSIIQTCDFLVIDDLGAEIILNKITVENLLNIISARLEYSKPFLITTNLSMNEISLKYGERLFSRLTGKQTVTLNFDGADLRKVK